jgi:hypothetical protein
VGADLARGELDRRRLDAHVLDRVRGDLRPDQRLDGVEQRGRGQQREGGRAGVKGRVGPDLACGQRDVERLEIVEAGGVGRRDALLKSARGCHRVEAPGGDPMRAQPL